MYNNKVYILRKGIIEVVYGNMSVMCRNEGLDYGKVRRALRRVMCYSEEGVYIVKKDVIRTKRV